MPDSVDEYSNYYKTISYYPFSDFRPYCPNCGEVQTTGGCGCKPSSWTITTTQGDAGPTVGWICPICDRGVAPFAESCPCKEEGAKLGKWG